MTPGHDDAYAKAGSEIRPALAAANKTESYLLTITGPGGVGVSRRLVVERGQRIDLGRVVGG